MSTLMHELFGVTRPIIAVVHLPPLPGAPLYDEPAGISGILERVTSDVDELVRGGVDGLLFCNAGDRPYTLTAAFEAVAAMTALITQVAPRDIPFGIDFMMDAKASLAIALATGAAFVRIVRTGVYDSDMGLWNTDAATVLRYRRAIGAQHVRVFCNITPEFAVPLGARSVQSLAVSAVFTALADAILVAGPMAGAAPDLSEVREARAAVGEQVPVLMNTGARVDNIRRFLQVADGVLVGSSLRVEGYSGNPIEAARVQAFMAAVRHARSEGPGAKS